MSKTWITVIFVFGVSFNLVAAQSGGGEVKFICDASEWNNHTWHPGPPTLTKVKVEISGDQRMMKVDLGPGYIELGAPRISNSPLYKGYSIDRSLLSPGYELAEQKDNLRPPQLRFKIKEDSISTNADCVSVK